MERGTVNVAACAEHPKSLFFPEQTDRQTAAASIRHAIALCDTCPLQEGCLQGAYTRKETFGVWGGVDFHIYYRKKMHPNNPNNRPPWGGRTTVSAARTQ